MQYNTTREKLIKPEYGRHIQKMVQHAMTLSSKEERTKCAKAIVSFLVQSNNVSAKNIEEAEKKYWNQIHIISDFKLDVDSKYPLPEMDKLAEKPKKLSYPIRNIQFSFYGLSILLIKILLITKLSCPTYRFCLRDNYLFLRILILLNQNL